MLTQICAEIKNYFCKKEDVIIGDFEIVNGNIVPSISLASGQYFRIVGSIFNDGVHSDSDTLSDEGKFHGAVWIMSPPKDFLDLVAEIEAWQEKYGGVESANMSPYQSESFFGYSYSKGSGGSSSAGASSVPTWQSTYASRLKRFRRIRVI